MLLQNKVQPDNVSHELVPVRDSDRISDHNGSYVLCDNNLQEVPTRESTPVQAESHRAPAE